MEQMIRVKIQRQVGGEDSETVSYEVPFKEGMSVIGVLENLYEEHGIAYRHQCDVGLCGICLMKINGKTRFACKEVLNEPADITLEPLNGCLVLRDLVVEMDIKEERSKRE